MFVLSRRPPRLAVAAALLALGVTGILVLLRDVHGAAAVAGVALTFLFDVCPRSQNQRMH